MCDLESMTEENMRFMDTLKLSTSTDWDTVLDVLSSLENLKVISLDFLDSEVEKSVFDKIQFMKNQGKLQKLSVFCGVYV